MKHKGKLVFLSIEIPPSNDLSILVARNDKGNIHHTKN